MGLIQIMEMATGEYQTEKKTRQPHRKTKSATSIPDPNPAPPTPDPPPPNLPTDLTQPEVVSTLLDEKKKEPETPPTA